MDLLRFLEPRALAAWVFIIPETALTVLVFDQRVSSTSTISLSSTVSFWRRAYHRIDVLALGGVGGSFLRLLQPHLIRTVVLLGRKLFYVLALMQDQPSQLVAGIVYQS